MKNWFKISVIVVLIVGTVIMCGCTTTAPTTTLLTVTPSSQPVSSPLAASGTTTPDLTGIWKGTTVGHTEKEGFVEYPVATYNITAQKGPAFTGVKEYPRMDGKTYYEGFSGIVTKYNEIFMGDYNTGYIEGRLTGSDSMELYYIDEGADAKAFIIDLTRQKI